LVHLSTKKLDELCRLLKEDLRNEQVLVWFRFNAELMAAVKRLSELNIKVAYITGKVDKKNRPPIVKAFQSHVIQVLAMQVKCGRFGLDCSAADTAIYYSNPYDGEDRAQTEDRIVHPKKTKPLLLMDLITQGSIDEDVIRILKRKRLSSRQFMRTLISDLANKWKLTHGSKKINRIFPADQI
jgi:SNF2 family DNA or RNA helicase